MPGGVNKNDLVAHVVKNSPADKAGLRDGDILVKIDQLDVTVWRTQPEILPLCRFWEQAPGTKLRLALRRNEVPVVAEVELRNILGPLDGRPDPTRPFWENKNEARLGRLRLDVRHVPGDQHRLAVLKVTF